MKTPRTHNFSKILSELISSTWFILTILMLAMLYFRIVPIYHAIFTDWPWLHGNYVNFAPDDAVYHMRLVHNTLQHFPHRVFFDPFTHIPYGNQIHFGPLFTLIIATLAWVLGLGHPSATLINAVGAYVPPVMGALCIIPTYFIGKKIFGRNAGLLAAAILAFLPGEFFYRSALGFTDHHVAEVLFSTLTLVFLVYALAAAEKNKRQMLIYSIFTGVALGLYLLTWPAALLVAAILFIFFGVQIIRNYWQGCDNHALLVIVIMVYVIPALLVLPYALMNPQIQLGYYSLVQPIILITFLIVLFCFYSLAKISTGCNFQRWLYPLIILSLLAVIVGGIKIFIPNLWAVIVAGIKLLFHPKLGMLTVAEVWPAIIERQTNALTYRTIWYNFFWIFPLALIAATRLIEKIIKENRVNYLLLLIWSIGMLLAMFSQQRFAYYFAVNAALLAGYGCAEFLHYLIQNFLYAPQTRSWKYLKFTFFMLGIFSLLLAIIYPRTILNKGFASYGNVLPREMFDAYMWLNQHTPDPEGVPVKNNFNYARGFYPIPRGHYVYPASAYGITAWWNVGHQITYVAERIPNDNPFQQGIFEENHTGVAPFFTSTDEKKALHNLDVMHSRYVLIDNEMNNYQYQSMLIWQELDTKQWGGYAPLSWMVHGVPKIFKLFYEGKSFYASMFYRLYFLDGNSLSRLRLVYESPKSDYIVNFKAVDIKTGLVDYYFYRTGNDLTTMQQTARNGVKPQWEDDKQERILYGAKPPVKDVKIFEKVTGAILVGRAPQNAKVKLQLNLQTNSGRTFTYKQETIATTQGYKFIVPYATMPMQGNGYSSAIKALAPYIIQVENHPAKLVEVPESAVQSGAVVKSNE